MDRGGGGRILFRYAPLPFLNGKALIIQKHFNADVLSFFIIYC